MTYKHIFDRPRLVLQSTTDRGKPRELLLPRDTDDLGLFMVVDAAVAREVTRVISNQFSPAVHVSNITLVQKRVRQGGSLDIPRRIRSVGNLKTDVRKGS